MDECQQQKPNIEEFDHNMNETINKFFDRQMTQTNFDQSEATYLKNEGIEPSIDIDVVNVSSKL